MVATVVTRNRLGFLGCLAAFAGLAQVGCAQTRGHVPDPSGAGGDPGVQSVVTEVPLEPETCGIVRRIALPVDVPLDFGFEGKALRQNGGFSLGPWSEGDSAQYLSGFLMGDSATWSSFSARGGFNDNHWSVFLGGSGKLIDVFVGGRVPGPDDSFETRTWSNGDNSPSKGGKLLDAYWRGTDKVAAKPSLDGNSAVFAIWPTAISEPRAALIGSDGEVVGSAHSLAPLDHTITDCEQVTPTQHGGIISFIDLEQGALRLIELGGGEGAIDATLPEVSAVDPARCPLIAPDEAGALLLIAQGETGESWQLTSVHGGGSSGASTIQPQHRPRALTRAHKGVLILESDAEGTALEMWTANESRRFEVSGLGYSQLISSEPGAIFLDVTTGMNGPHEIVELGCR